MVFATYTRNCKLQWEKFYKIWRVKEWRFNFCAGIHNFYSRKQLILPKYEKNIYKWHLWRRKAEHF